MSNLFGDLNINWNEVEKSSFAPLPPGVYAAKVTKTDVAKTKDGTGKYLKAEFSLLGGKGIKGRKVFEMFNFVNKNEEAVRIGLGKFKTLCEVVGKDPDQMTDSSELIGSMVTLKLKVDGARDGYEAQNRIQDFKEFDEDLATKTLSDIEESSF